MKLLNYPISFNPPTPIHFVANPVKMGVASANKACVTFLKNILQTDKCQDLSIKIFDVAALATALKFLYTAATGTDHSNHLVGWALLSSLAVCRSSFHYTKKMSQQIKDAEQTDVPPTENTPKPLNNNLEMIAGAHIKHQFEKELFTRYASLQTLVPDVKDAKLQQYLTRQIYLNHTSCDKNIKEAVGVHTNKELPPDISVNSHDQHFEMCGKKIYLASTIGDRSENQDAYIVDLMKIQGIDIPLFGIFDGHGDSSEEELHTCSHFFKEHIKSFLTEKLNSIDLTDHKGIASTLKNIFSEIHSHHIATHPEKSKEQGTTALIAITIHDILWVANVGDCRGIIILPNGKFIQLSDDAKPEKERFRAHIENNGGTVIIFEEGEGPPRLNGHLSLARNVGMNNPEINQGSSLNAKVTGIDLNALRKLCGDGFKRLIIACDGYWDAHSSQEAADLFAGRGCDDSALTGLLEQPAVVLRNSAYHNRPPEQDLVIDEETQEELIEETKASDNITVIVAEL